MKLKNPILSSKSWYIQLFLLVITIISKLSFSQHTGLKGNKEWEILKSLKEVEIRYRYDECSLPSQGTHYENVYLQFINKTSEKIIVTWKNEYWYDEKCYGCDNTSSEFEKSITLDPFETAEGKCAMDTKKQLVILSKMLDLENQSVLTNFNLKDIEVTIAAK